MNGLLRRLHTQALEQHIFHLYASIYAAKLYLGQQGIGGRSVDKAGANSVSLRCMINS